MKLDIKEIDGVPVKGIPDGSRTGLETGKVYAQYIGVSWNGLHIYILQYMSAGWSETIKVHLFLKGTT